MGKQLERLDSSVGGNRPGCMWSLMNILDYHHWSNVKKILPHRKRAGGKRVRRNYGSRKATSENREIGKRPELVVAEAESLLVKQHSTETSTAKKRSCKSRKKASSSKDKPREDSPKRWILSFPVQSWLRRTSVVHDAEPSENCLDTTRNGSITSPRGLQDSSHLKMSKNTMKRELPLKDVSSDTVIDHVDILELFKVNKEFFFKILQDPEVSTNQFPGLKNSKNKVRLTKSRSFPFTDSSRARNRRPSTLKHKQNEVWSFAKGEKLLATTQTLKSMTSESQEDYSMKSKHYMEGNNSVGSTMQQETSFSSLGLPEEFSHQGWNQLVINRFRHITQKLMHALQESKKENSGNAIESLFWKDPSGRDGKEVLETLELTTTQEGIKVHGLDDNLGRQRRQRVRRTSSLDESLSRYTQLYESSYSSDQRNLHHSKSLKLKSEEKVPSTGNAQKTTRRNLSLTDLDSFSSILNGALVKDAFRLGIPVTKAAEQITDKSEQRDAILESDDSANIADIKDSDEHAVVPLVGESTTHQEQEMVIAMSRESEQAQPMESSNLDPPDYITSNAMLSISEGSELNPGSPHANELNSSLDLQGRHIIDSLSESSISTEIEHKSSITHSSRFVVDKVDDPDSEFSYVRYVLELSGFIGQEHLGAWYSLDQPLDPTMFMELEDCFQHEPESYEDQLTSGNCDHRLLFDLVNETLLAVYERSYTYFPRALYFSGNIRPMPKGQRLLDDVWTRVSSYLSLRPEMDQSLDDVVARDLAKGDRWMNLQWETECVALELEELIFDGLLDEVICA
ncbi:protein TRM32 [Pyrus x bretschneideri]|uniref:protein TRM32 n=1 Tax=Pyrus x bretschneideri TaxID=225117 RepID=UPI000511B825|nr:protein TRM32 [Pyrus x bretschneideri]XP_009353682.1 protein TRM32 [Pyrus x bretschneideri]